MAVLEIVLFFVAGALRFMRKIINLKDEFYNRYITKGNLFAPVIDAFVMNSGRYNLLDSAILEMFEHIRLEDIKSLCTHVIEHFGPTLDKIHYVQTFKNLRQRYEQNQDRQKDRQQAQLDKYVLFLFWAMLPFGGIFQLTIFFFVVSSSFLVWGPFYDLDGSEEILDSWKKKRKCGSTTTTTKTRVLIRDRVQVA